MDDFHGWFYILITDRLSLTREAFYGEYYNLITNCSNIATSLLNIATSFVFTKDVAILAKDVAMLGRTLLDVKSLSQLKRVYLKTSSKQVGECGQGLFK